SSDVCSSDLVFPLHRSPSGANASRVVLPVSFKPSEREKEIATYKNHLKGIADKSKGNDLLLVSFAPDMRNKKHWGSRVSVPPAISVEEVVRIAVKSKFLSTEDSIEYLKGIYANSDI